MKKLLFIFVLLDFVFVGLILKYSGIPSRTISSFQEDLTEGQKNKWQLVETLNFATTLENLELHTDKLQMICETSSLIELRYFAQNIAYAGVQPSVTHIFSCDSVRKNQSQEKLITPLPEFQKIHKLKSIELQNSKMVAGQLYSDEEFPISWKLAEIKVIGPNTFTINEYEIEKVHGHAFDFEVTISAK